MPNRWSLVLLTCLVFASLGQAEDVPDPPLAEPLVVPTLAVPVSFDFRDYCLNEALELIEGAPVPVEAGFQCTKQVANCSVFDMDDSSNIQFLRTIAVHGSGYVSEDHRNTIYDIVEVCATKNPVDGYHYAIMKYTNSLSAGGDSNGACKRFNSCTLRSSDAPDAHTWTPDGALIVSIQPNPKVELRSANSFCEPLSMQPYGIGFSMQACSSGGLDLSRGAYTGTSVAFRADIVGDTRWFETTSYAAVLQFPVDFEQAIVMNWEQANAFYHHRDSWFNHVHTYTTTTSLTIIDVGDLDVPI